jgi:hypothetical protein
LPRVEGGAAGLELEDDVDGATAAETTVASGGPVVEIGTVELDAPEFGALDDDAADDGAVELGNER